MTRTYGWVPAFAASLTMLSASALAADQAPAPQSTQVQQKVYGRDLMTEQERAEHHARMQAAQSEQERKQLRHENHKRMKERADERGLSMPAEPPSVAAGKKDGTHKKQGESHGQSQ